MNLFKRVLVVFSTIALLAACGGKDNKSEEKKEGEVAKEPVTPANDPAGKLQGTWEIKRAEGTAAGMNLGTIYEFSGNKLTLSATGIVTPGATGITDSTFSFQPDGNERKYVYHYRFSGDTLVANIDIGGGQIFYLVKK